MPTKLAKIPNTDNINGPRTQKQQGRAIQCCGSTGSVLPTHRLCVHGSYRTAFRFESRFSPSAFEGDQGIRFKRDFHCCALSAEPSCLLPSEFLGSLNLPRGGEGLQWSNHLTEILGQ